MQIACPTCAKTYQIAATAIGPDGRSVRCGQCQKVWFIPAPGLMPTILSPDLAPPSADPDERVLDARNGVRPEPPSTNGSEDESPTPASVSQGHFETNPADSMPRLSDITIGRTAASSLPDIGFAYSKSRPNPSTVRDKGLPPANAATVETDDLNDAVQRRRLRSLQRRKNNSAKMMISAAVVLLCFIVAALIGLRKNIVRHAPQMASFYEIIGLPVNLRGLAFTDVKVSSELLDGVTSLVVEGMITNTVGVPVDVPRIRFALRNAAGAEVYSWTAQSDRPILDPAESIPFRSRLASPPVDGQNLQVRFWTRHDISSPR